MTKFKQGWPLKLIGKEEQAPSNTRFLKNEAVILSVPSLKHYEEWAQLRDKNKDFLKIYEPEWAKDATSLNFYKRRLMRQKQEVLGRRGAFFFIFDAYTNALVGGINLNNIIYGAAHYASLGYWLGEEYQGKGYMRHAIHLVQNYAFDVLKLRRLNAACLPDNQKSIKVLTHCGFVEEGYAPEYLQINGQWQDHRLFGLINSARSSEI